MDTCEDGADVTVVGLFRGNDEDLVRCGGNVAPDTVDVGRLEETEEVIVLPVVVSN